MAGRITSQLSLLQSIYDLICRHVVRYPGPYGHEGLATHPNDEGMAAIAQAVIGHLKTFELSEAEMALQ
jgi:hypothetical protein